MATAVNTVVMQAAYLRGIAVPKILPKELEAILYDKKFTDTKTEELRIWHRDFKAALAIAVDGPAGGVGYAEGQYKELLRKILRDPLTQAPFEEVMDDYDQDQVFLGSDGKTYSLATIFRWQNGDIDPIYKNRSPMSPTDEAVFTFAPHPVVRYFMKWLHLKDTGFSDARKAERRTATKAFDRVMNKKIIDEERAAKAARKEAALAEQKALEEGRVRAGIQAALAPADELDQRGHEAIMEELHRPDEAERIKAVARHAKIEKMNADLTVMDVDIEQMKAQINENGAGIEGLDARFAEINTQVIATAKAIEERKKAEVGNALKAILIIGVCCFAGWALAGLAAKAGASATVTTSISGGTPMIGASFAK